MTIIAAVATSLARVVSIAVVGSAMICNITMIIVAVVPIPASVGLPTANHLVWTPWLNVSARRIPGVPFGCYVLLALTRSNASIRRRILRIAAAVARPACIKKFANKAHVSAHLAR